MRTSVLLFLLLLASCTCRRAPPPPCRATPRPGAAIRSPAPPELLAFAPGATERPGPREDGSILLPNGWGLDPYGKQVPLAWDLPVRMVWHPAGRWLAVQHAGNRGHGVTVFDARAEEVVAEIRLPSSWSGMAFSEDGERLFVSGGVRDVVDVFRFDPETGQARRIDTWPAAVGEGASLPAGLCTDGRGGILVALQRADRIVRLDADGTMSLGAALPKDSFPFECRRRGDVVAVSLWGAGTVALLDADTLEEVARLETGPHPSEMTFSPDGSRLFVSHGNANTVSVIDVARRRVEETIGSALYPHVPPGSTPDSVAVSPDGRTLLVANADNDDVAVIDVSARGRSRGLGFVPVGMYPTSVRFSPDGTTVFVANGKGSGGSHANPGGPAPGHHEESQDDYTGSMFKGSLSVFPVPNPTALRSLTARAYGLAPLARAAAVRSDAPRPPGSPIPARPGDPSPIRHCVYVIKENRTYDQVLGDDPRGDGDPDLCLFPEEVSPNHHAIARDFVLLDNFYVDAEVSADGHEWSMGAYATDFVERTWPVTYGGKGRARGPDGKVRDLGYPSEGSFPVAFPSNGYLWDLAKRAGISYRSYGEFVENGDTPDDPGTTNVPALEGHFDPLYRSFDLGYPDTKRADRFLAELAEIETSGELPRLVVIRLPNDHTSGTRVGRPTPRAAVADNDLALGRLLEGLSHSRFWPTTAVFVVEDDAQNGPDHVDAHRSVALVAGPYVRRGAVVHDMYSTCSLLRTMELILGLPPMSQYDAAARPMYACFTDVPDLTPYAAREATWPTDEKNVASAWGAAESEGIDLEKADEVDDLAFSELVWHAVKGPDAPMPPPRRAAFVRPPAD